MNTLLKKLIKQWLSRRGYTLSARKYIPQFVDYREDILQLKPARPIEIIFDVGANVGNTVVDFYEAFPSSEIHAFEPVMETYRQLLVRTGMLRRVQPYHCALGAIPKTAKIVTQKQSEWNSLVGAINRAEDEHAHVEEVRIKTIDEVCREKAIHRIDILKTDTEGYDLEVLQGGRDMLASGGIMFVVCEVGFDHDDIRHTSFWGVSEALYSSGFGFWGLYDVNHCVDLPKVSYCNALFINAKAL
jgi:FkbM family methyltransferase